MEWWEILLVVAIAGFAIGTMIVATIKRKQGKSSCCSDCTSCGYRCSCGININEKNDFSNNKQEKE